MIGSQKTKDWVSAPMQVLCQISVSPFASGFWFSQLQNGSEVDELSGYQTVLAIQASGHPEVKKRPTGQASGPRPESVISRIDLLQPFTYNFYKRLLYMDSLE